jgi:hypothetical protein
MAADTTSMPHSANLIQAIPHHSTGRYLQRVCSDQHLKASSSGEPAGAPVPVAQSRSTGSALCAQSKASHASLQVHAPRPATQAPALQLSCHCSATSSARTAPHAQATQAAPHQPSMPGTFARRCPARSRSRHLAHRRKKLRRGRSGALLARAVTIWRAAHTRRWDRGTRFGGTI